MASFAPPGARPSAGAEGRPGRGPGCCCRRLPLLLAACALALAALPVATAARSTPRELLAASGAEPAVSQPVKATFESPTAAAAAAVLPPLLTPPGCARAEAVFIISTGRTGSTTLLEVVNSLPGAPLPPPTRDAPPRCKRAAALASPWGARAHARGGGGDRCG